MARAVTNKDVMVALRAAYEEAATARGMTQAIYGEMLVTFNVPKEEVHLKLDRCLETARKKAALQADELFGSLGIQLPPRMEDANPEPVQANPPPERVGREEGEIPPPLQSEVSVVRALERVPMPAPEEHDEDYIHIGPALDLR